MRVSYARWIAAIERHHRGIVVASVLVCLLSALSLTRLRLDIDVLGMLPQGQPAFDDFKAFVADFGELDQLFILVQGRPVSGLHAFADAFAARLGQLDTVATVRARFDVQPLLDGVLGRYLYNYLPEQDYAELARRLTPAGIAAQLAADRAALSAPFDLSAARAVAGDPLGVRRLAAAALAGASSGFDTNLNGGYLSTPDGRAVLLLVRPKASAFDIAFSKRLMREVRAAAAATRQALGPPAAGGALRVDYTGSYVYALEDAATLRRDIARYTTLALLGVLAVFSVGYRNLRILPFVTYPLVVTTLLTFALSLLLFAELNAVSVSFAAILYGLSIDSAIYFYTRLLQERRHQDLRAAMTATLAGLGRANVAASTTTAAAFFVIGFSCLSAVRQLGFLTALGMVLTTVEFFTLYPALGFLLARYIRPDVSGYETPGLAACSAAATRRARPLAWGALLAGVGLLLAARHTALDVRLTHLQPRHSDAARVQGEIAARFGRQEPAAAVLVERSDLEDALVDAERVAGQLAAYRRAGWVRAVQSVAPLLPSARVQRARLARFNRLPRAAAVQTLRETLQRQGFVPQRFARFCDDFVRPHAALVHLGDPALAPLAFLLQRYVRARHGAYIVATYVQPGAQVSLTALAERLRHDLGGMRFTVAARALLEERLAAVLRRELAAFWVLGLVGNFVLLLISFGSLGIATAILAPVVLVVVALFAGMWAAGVALDPVNLVVTPLIFGLGVDYGVYIVARARERGALPDAIRYAGRAVVVTALTTVTGFGFLGLSRYPALASMGTLAGVGLFLCLLLSVLLLPALLTLLAREWRHRE